MQEVERKDRKDLPHWFLLKKEVLERLKTFLFQFGFEEEDFSDLSEIQVSMNHVKLPTTMYPITWILDFFVAEGYKVVALEPGDEYVPGTLYLSRILKVI